MAKDLTKWLKSGQYLPRFMRDFHDQKDLFKAIHTVIDQNETANIIGWVNAQIYVIDVFLWFMARRGYTLQRTRAKCDFLDLDKTVHDAKALYNMAPIPLSQEAASAKSGEKATPETKKENE